MPIKVLVAGGTIDKKYNPINGELELTSSNIKEMLEEGKTTANFTIETIFLKDSLEMGDSCRDEILNVCKSFTEEKIIITHGTDTMENTAKLLGENLIGKTVVITGAMIPYSFKNSDALFNLGSAITAVSLLKNGVYIAMNGKIFSYDNVVKNKIDGVFELKSKHII